MKSFKKFNVGVAGTQYDHPKYYVGEVAPPGWGHTKAEKEKTDPSKPKSKIGGSAAAFDRARKEGRFKGSKADMFKLMWWMKNKGGKPKGKPHYKPGTDEKYKKYQDKDETNESVMPNVSHKDKGAIKKRYKNLFTKDLSGNKQGVNEGKCDDCTCTGCGSDGVSHQNPCVECGEHHKEENVNETLSVKDSKKLAKASALSHSDNPKDQDRARARQVEIDYKDLMRQRKKGKVGVGKSMRTEGHKTCGEGEYYCYDMGKCRPIPKGHKVREDGELVKEATTMRDNNLFGNAYAGLSPKLKREKKKAIDRIPNKRSEVYSRNLKHKSPIDPRESVELLDADGKVAHQIIDIIKPEPMKVPEPSVKWKELTELRKLPNYNKTGNIIDVYLAWRGSSYMIQMFFPQVSKPSRKDVIDQLQKVYPGSKIHSYQIGTYNPGEPVLQIN